MQIFLKKITDTQTSLVCSKVDTNTTPVNRFFVAPRNMLLGQFHLGTCGTW
jgi:hypothetical protein